MKALVLEKKKIRLEDVPKPKPLAGEAVIKVLKAGICRTDLELAGGYMQFTGILGHEFVGIVEDSPEKGWIGKRVVGEINISCGQCIFCQRGMAKHCPSRSVLGIANKNGAFAEYLTLPMKNCHFVADGISDHEAVFVEPLAAALDVFDKVSIGKEDEVLVLGDGKLGMLIALTVNQHARKVHCVGKHERNLGILRRQGIVTALRSEAQDDKFAVVVESTGREDGLSDALGRVAPTGKIVLKSTLRDNVRIDISQVVVDEIQMLGSRCGSFPDAIRALEKKSIPVTETIDGEFPLERGLEAFSLAREPGTLKVLLTP